MTGFVKIDPNHTGTEIHFIGEHKSLTLALGRNAQHMAIDGQVCFRRWPFAISVRPLRCTIGPLGPVNGINKDVNGTRLLPMTVSTYPMDWVSFCHLLKTQHCYLCPIEGITWVWLLILPHHPPTPTTHPLPPPTHSHHPPHPHLTPTSPPPTCPPL